MNDAKNQLANRLKEANNVLVTVTNNPSVDQFASAIALTLILNKLGKHATTVFSGTIPSLVEFLQPEKVVEKNTDSLRDFIISLDKSKADKLRYKIEDNYVKIFITPYHSSIGQSDLVFSQGDFNVDVVVGLGVHKREELDQAIIAHGRILHDATVTTINTQPPSTLGSINWSNGTSSSICEMLVDLTDLLAKQGLLDTQISNALLTGIVAETQRFSNRKTTAVTMSFSSKLLASGANQQLVATQLTPKPAAPPPPPPPKPVVAPKPVAPPPPKPVEKPNEAKNVSHSAMPQQLKSVDTDKDKKKNDFGVLEISHDPNSPDEVKTQEEKVAEVSIDDQGQLVIVGKEEDKPAESAPPEPTQATDNAPEQKPTETNNESTNAQNTAAPISLPPVVEAPPVAPEELHTPEVQASSVPTYVPPPLVPIPPDSGIQPSLEPIPTEQPAPPAPSQPAPATQSTFAAPPPPPPPVSEDNIGVQSQVAQPPPTDAQLNSDLYGNNPGENNSVDGVAAFSSSVPLLSHNSGNPSSNEKNHIKTIPVPEADLAQFQKPNLTDVRNAVNEALSANPDQISNQPTAALNSQPVNLNLTPPPQAPIAPGSSMDPLVIAPNGQTAPQPGPGQSPSAAPPVPPPIVPINDSNNLPPSFNAL